MSNPPPPPRVIDAETEHTIKNHLSVIVGFCDLLLAETAADDPRRSDLQEIHKSGRALIDLFHRKLTR